MLLWQRWLVPPPLARMIRFELDPEQHNPELAGVCAAVRRRSVGVTDEIEFDEPRTDRNFIDPDLGRHLPLIDGDGTGDDHTIENDLRIGRGRPGRGKSEQQPPLFVDSDPEPGRRAEPDSSAELAEGISAVPTLEFEPEAAPLALARRRTAPG